MLLKISRLALLLALALGYTISVQAQKMSHSELRKKRQQEKDLENQEEEGGEVKNEKPSEKRSQFKVQALIKARFEDDVKFEETAIPEKWKNESAVVIYQKQQYAYLRTNFSLAVDEMVRKRIKLLDKAAVLEFSELYYIKGGDLNAIGINVIKPDGKEIHIPVTDAIEVSEEIPRFYRSYYQSGDKYFKLAVPELEPGDILDYYYFTHREMGSRSMSHAFYPLIFTLNSTYPILSQAFQFKIDYGFHIDFNSYNGASTIKEVGAGADAEGRKPTRIKQYELMDTAREKLDNDLWDYELRSNPFVKFMVTYIGTDAVYFNKGFIGSRGDEVKSSVSGSEVEIFVRPRTENESGSDFAMETTTYLYRTQPNETNPGRIARAAYYYLRYRILNYYYETSLADSKDKERNDFFTIDDYKFASILRQVLWRRSLKAQIIVTIPRDQGIIKDVLFPNELCLFVHVENGDSDFYVYPFHNYSSFDTHDELLEGTDAYAVMPIATPDAELYWDVKTPVSSPSRNMYASTIEVTPDEKMENMEIIKTTGLSGLFKNPKSSILYLSNFDYLGEDRKKYSTTDNGAEADKGSRRQNAKKPTEEEARKAASAREEKVKEQTDRLKRNAGEDFHMVSYDQFEVLNSGRYDEDPALRFKETYKISGLMNAAGRNTIFEIGKLIGKQIELKEKDMIRNKDIYQPFARTISNTVIINLPPGLQTEGLSDLNIHVENETGAFQSSAKQEGNKIIITTQKIYKSNFEKKENWGKLTDVIEAAYKFTQKKIILKKA